MKTYSGLKSLLAILLITQPLIGSAQPSTINSANAPATSETTKNGYAASETGQRSAAYSGYSVDGRTSASVIAAQRSHSVSEEDETGLAIYSGLFVIAVIAFFVRTLSKNK